MPWFSRTKLHLGFILLMANVLVLAMNDPNDPNNVRFPEWHLVPFNERPVLGFDALPEHQVPIPKALVDQRRASTQDGSGSSSSEPQPIGSESSSGKEERDPNDWPSRLYPKAVAQDEAGTSSSRSVPTIQDRLDIPLLSLQPDSRTFRSVEYPLWSPDLEHLYSDDGSEPADFIKQSPRASASKRKFYLEVKPVRYYPEPKLLTAVQNALLEKLRSLSIGLGNPNPLNEQFYHGTWLLPPLEMTEKGLNMPHGVLNSALATVVETRFRNPNPSEAALLYRLDVKVEGKDRHILAATALPSVHADMGPVVGGASGSHLWLFYESRTVPAERKNALAVLGGMFLPSEARKKFLQTNLLSIVTRPE
ncbi:uncharacterized protein UTRI_10397_B [Ustilago trichophora]|uniref:Effector family protein Eff1 n=1 Tax=Ustilago trichophora TaxID=86804 RepID=A0A5C3E8A8_9BASI|nr:uncharacterized protein UTRI_10397_B [Ustilago trichophora]